MNDGIPPDEPASAPVEYAAPAFPAPYFPGQQPVGTTAPPARGWKGKASPRLVISLAVTTIGVLVAVGVVVALSGGEAPDRGTPARVEAGAPSPTNSAEQTNSTPVICSSPPTARVGGVRADGAQLVASVEFRTSCGDGDVVSSNAETVAIRSGSQILASARFDFSSEPVTLAGGSPATVDLRFDRGDYWVVPGGVDPSQAEVTLQDTGTSMQPRNAASQVSSQSTSISSVGPALPLGADVQAVSYDGLRALQEADAGSVRTDVVDRWVPQLSSKRVGLVAEGITWKNTDILREQFDFRSRFPETRLLWTSDWSSFDLRDWWVTVVALPFPDPAGANAWCASKRLDRDHCFAKRVTTSGGSDGTTVLQN